MRVGIIVPQGWTGEYDGWDPARAWARTVAVAHEAEDARLRLAVDVRPRPDGARPDRRDHVRGVRRPQSALAAETARVRLGHLVLCAGYRNPALVAKMISTLDVVSGGRAELGLGRRLEGGRVPSPTASASRRSATRMEMLEDALEIATRMLGGGRATYEGPAARVRDAINVPRGLQEPRIPILVGGNGPNRTWRLAARFADELNLDWFTPEEVVATRPVIASRCEEIGRDPATLRISVNIGRDDIRARGGGAGGPAAPLRDAGVDRVMTLIRASADDDGALERFAEDCVAAGCELAG